EANVRPVGVSPGISINATAGDIVGLRGLVIDGDGNGDEGINFQQASALHIQNCVIRNFESGLGWGIYFAPFGNARLLVSDSIVYNTGGPASSGGILVQPMGASGSATVVLDRVHLENDVVGLLVDGSASTGTGAHVIVRD